MLLRNVFLLLLCLVAATPRSRADDGYRLWLKYDRVANTTERQAYAPALRLVARLGTASVLRAASGELQRGLGGLPGQPVPVVAAAGSRTGGVILRVDGQASAGGQLLKPEDYRIVEEQHNLVITGRTDRAVLYGASALLRQVQTRQPLAGLHLSSNPRINFRLLNHWDNPNGTVERGYAGSSIWQWYELPARLDPCYTDYARANASIGTNGVVLNNVNASARYLSAEYIGKVAAVAGVLRPYGQRVYLSVMWAAPKVIGGLNRVVATRYQ